MSTSAAEINPSSASVAPEEKWVTFAAHVACRALTILTPNGYADDLDPSLSVTAEKVIAEAAIFLLAAARAAHRNTELREAVDALADRLIPLARTESVRAQVCNEPSMVLDHCCAHICLSAAGYPDRRYDRLLQMALEGAIGSNSRDRLPYQQLEYRWLEDLLYHQRGCSPDSSDPLVMNSALGRPLDVLAGTGGDAYSVTHAVMFATDLGRNRIALPRPARVISADLDAALAVSLDRHDYDIGGEVLMCWPMLGLAFSPTAVFGYRLLSAVNHQIGFLPTPVVDVSRYSNLDIADRDGYLLATTYHTIFVMGMLGATVLVTDIQPGAVPGTPAGDTQAKLLPHLDLPRPPQWWNHFLAYGQSERASLTPLLFTVALRRAVDSRDLTAVDDLLRVADGLDGPSLPAVTQGRDLLYRAAVHALTDWSESAAPE